MENGRKRKFLQQKNLALSSALCGCRFRVLGVKKMQNDKVFHPFDNLIAKTL